MTKPTHTVVWNADKTEGFVTIDRQLAYQVRKSADTNCFDADGRRSDVGIAFCDAWGDQDCTMEPLANSSELNIEELGQAADTVDNLLSAESIPIPATLAKEGRVASLTELRSKLRKIYTDATGENPWATHPKD